MPLYSCTNTFVNCGKRSTDWARLIVPLVLKGLPDPGNRFKKGLVIVAERLVFAAVSRAVAVQQRQQTSGAGKHPEHVGHVDLDHALGLLF